MKTRLFILAAAVTFITLTATAQGPFNEEPVSDDFMAENVHPQMQKDTDKGNFFTEEQKEAIKAIRLEGQKEAKPFKDQLRELNAHHQTLVTAKKADLNAIFSSIEKRNQVKTELEKIRANSQQKIRSLLTEEQLIAFDSKRDMMKRRHEQRGEKGVKPRDRFMKSERKFYR